MTIGIAAYGPGAGRGIVKALAAIEAVGRGAVGGFVSFVALTPEGGLARAATQHGGITALFGPGGEAMPAALAGATIAGLMSSGPERPEPLSQFTPARAGVGLVTGHRMPNTPGSNGINVNDEVLALMARGHSPRQAVERVVEANPAVDAGMIALSVDGGMHFANTAHVLRRGDAGSALLGSRAAGSVVGVMHNAIHPYRPLAALAAEVALDVMQPADRPDGWITFRRGVPLAAGAATMVTIGEAGTVEAITVDDPKFLKGSWSLGIGYQAGIVDRNGAPGIMLYEPYMLVADGTLRAIDGQDTLAVPVRRR